MEACNKIASPLNPSADLVSCDGDKIFGGFDYRSLIRSLIYLAMKRRSDIAVTTSMLSRHAEKPTQLHQAGVKRVLRYLKDTINGKM